MVDFTLIVSSPNVPVTAESPRDSSAHVAAGTIKIFAGEAMVIPTGLIAAAYLTRHLGPELYGVFTVAAAIVVWTELASTILITRPAVKFVAEAPDWMPVAAHLVRVQLLISALAGAILAAAAPIIAKWLHMSALTTPLRLLALDIPIFALMVVHRAFLIGRGAFSQAATPIALRWLLRLLLVMLLVELGLSIWGAVLATIGGSLGALLLVRVWIKPQPWRRGSTALPSVWGYAIYIFLSALAIQLFGRLDLLMVAAFTANPGAAGFYGAAQNLAIGPALLAGSFSPLLLAALTSLLRNGDRPQFRRMVLHAIRACLWLLPFAAVGSAASEEIAVLIYGAAFAPSGPIAAILLFAAMALLPISMAAAVLTAIGKPHLTMTLALPLVPVAAAAHAVIIPRFGAEGAAFVTAAAAWTCAAASIITVLRQTGTYLPPLRLFRVALVTGAAYLISGAWHMPGAWALVELIILAGLVAAAILWFEEVRGQDLLSIPIRTRHAVSRS